MSDLLVETIPTLSFDKQYMNNSKIGRIISTKPIEIVEECSELTIPVHGEIINIVDIWKDRNVSLSAYNITQFDMAVMDAAYTIINSGYTIIAPEWILKVMSGNMNARATPKKINAIKDSVDKLRSIHIQIDCTQEVNSRKDLKGKISKFVYKSYLLPLGELEVTYPCRADSDPEQSNHNFLSGCIPMPLPHHNRYPPRTRHHTDFSQPHHIFVFHLQLLIISKSFHPLLNENFTLTIV